jgi:TRAP-type C4-dicarboxylate transport system substrate-binding protein
MNKARFNSLPKDVQKVMLDMRKEQSLWTGNYMDEQIKKAIAWSRDVQKVEFIQLPAAEKAQWDSKLDFIKDKWIANAKAKGLPAEAIIKDIQSFIQ